CGRDLPLDYW
nr:immunoglobulin heavy chain junction region [Macaca mulatta]MOY23941.1 immunoglobulin heavy chain junction region [Macaca mulatta]MOY25893.1 immunoglobulin heavy chain junction region [Macaca mulatta]MOY27446.1 immunoglobulin heavy chain junction region [Macaca mulatta]MOY27850.1 immunoglobulin heavy chain junction region [Macaca mulatta]